MGETSLDEDTFDEYLMEMKTHYTVEKVWCRLKSRTNVDPDDGFSTTS